MTAILPHSPGVSWHSGVLWWLRPLLRSSDASHPSLFRRAKRLSQVYPWHATITFGLLL